MPKKKRLEKQGLQKQRDKKTLADVVREMARLRFAESTRKEQDEANLRVMKHHSFLDT